MGKSSAATEANCNMIINCFSIECHALERASEWGGLIKLWWSDKHNGPIMDVFFQVVNPAPGE